MYSGKRFNGQINTYQDSSIPIIVVRWQPGKGANRYCFLERETALRNRRKTVTVFFSGLFFFGYFLLEEQKKVTINSKEDASIVITYFLLSAEV